MYRGTLNPISNAATWTDELEFFDDETGEAMFEEDDDDTHPDDITLKLRDKDSGSTVLSGSLSGGELAISADGIVTFTFSASDMSGIDAKTYEVGVLYDADDVVTQLILGEISVLKGL